MKVLLCHDESDDLNVHVTAELDNGHLKISGHDSGEMCREIWGQDDYEYFYSMDSTNSAKLFNLLRPLCPGASDDELLEEFFSGTDCCDKFMGFCDAARIDYAKY